MEAEMTQGEFAHFQSLVHRIAGLSLALGKKLMVEGRLRKRLRAYGFHSFSEYFALVTDGQHDDELQTAVELLTTNETRFFREPKHFEFLGAQAHAHPAGSGGFRVWSAACSSGEEPWSIAMVLADELGEDGDWEVVASDLNSQVLEAAQRGHYPLARGSSIPPAYLTRFCLKGKGGQTGTFLIRPSLRSHVQMRQINLNERLPSLGKFDFVFLRNVMIYFDTETRRQVVARIVPHLKRTGFLLVGHSETLRDVSDQLSMLRPSIYQRT